MDQEPVTLVLRRLTEEGMGAAAPEFVAAVYDELRRRAQFQMMNERPGHTLQATALVNEAFVKLFEGAGRRFENRKHFYAVAAETMRQILIDHGRARRTAKRGSGAARSSIDDLDPALHPAAKASDEDEMDYEALDAALEQLRREDTRRYQVVLHRYFAGLSNKEISELMDVGERTVERDWQLARAYLQARVKGVG